jgi:hypothetical protein
MLRVRCLRLGLCGLCGALYWVTLMDWLWVSKNFCRRRPVEIQNKMSFLEAKDVLQK